LGNQNRQKTPQMFSDALLMLRFQKIAADAARKKLRSAWFSGKLRALLINELIVN